MTTNKKTNKKPVSKTDSKLSKKPTKTSKKKVSRPQTKKLAPTPESTVVPTQDTLVDKWSEQPAFVPQHDHDHLDETPVVLTPWQRLKRMVSDFFKDLI